MNIYPKVETKEQGEEDLFSTESSDVLMSLQELSLDSDQSDYAKLSENAQFKKMLIKHGDNFPSPEQLLYSRVVIKVECLAFMYLT